MTHFLAPYPWAAMNPPSKPGNPNKKLTKLIKLTIPKKNNNTLEEEELCNKFMRPQLYQLCQLFQGFFDGVLCVDGGFPAPRGMG